MSANDSDSRVKEADLFISALRDLVTPEELRNPDYAEVDPGSTYSLEDLRMDYLHDLMIAQSAQAVATIALVKAVQELAEAVKFGAGA